VPACLQDFFSHITHDAHANARPYTAWSIGGAEVVFSKLHIGVIGLECMYYYSDTGGTMRKPKRMSVRLSVDSQTAIAVHRAKHHYLVTDSAAINDIIRRYEEQCNESYGSESHVSDNSTIRVFQNQLNELNNAVNKVTTLGIRNFAMNIEMASAMNPQLPQKAEERARILVHQFKEKG
jgi:hypothetical protein